jgi:phage shock protein C
MTAPSHTRFYKNRQNRKWMGVCAGIADYTGIDVTVIRIGLVILTLIGGGPWTIIAYFIAGWMAPDKPAELALETPEKAKFWQGVRASPRRSIRDVRSRFRDLDRRLADVEAYVTSSNTRLAREIDQLR